jgi:SAM-dependent methyltransferase
VEQHRPPVSTAGYWDGLYAGGNDGWELGAPAPALQDWLDAGGKFEARLASRSRKARRADTAIGSPHVAVPGSGRGHDARLLARRGYAVQAFDFAEAAVAEARRLAQVEGVDVTVEQRDVFTLGRDRAGAFDGVWEYTCFCAIDPARRVEYTSVLHAILRPGGLLLACFYPLREGEDGPPFPVSRADIDRVLTGRFTVLEAGPPARSVERRRGLEWLVLARRTAS